MILKSNYVLNCVTKVSSSIVQSRRTSKYVPQYASQNDEVLVILKQLLEEMNSDLYDYRSYRVGIQEDV